MVSDIIGDSLTRIKNAIGARKTSVTLLRATVVESLLRILQEEGFINSFTVEENGINVELKFENDESAIAEVKRVSTPGQRVYIGYAKILPVLNGRGIAVISTPKGLMTGSNAKTEKLGGEYICNIW